MIIILNCAKNVRFSVARLSVGLQGAVLPIPRGFVLRASCGARRSGEPFPWVSTEHTFGSLIREEWVVI